MTREILLHVMPSAFCDPMALIQTTAADRAALSPYTRTFALVADPPPDTVFSRATDVDLGVFGEELPTGELMMIDAAFTLPLLEAAFADAAEKLTAFGNGAVTHDEVATALTHGVWAADADPRRASILQAAGFARQMFTAAVQAAPLGHAVVWEYTGGPCSYT